MLFPEIWRRATTSRRTHEREVAAQRENAQREGTLREEFARRTQALESQIAPLRAEIERLRAENRALLNSVLGIAGIPPVIVTDTTAPAGRPELPFVGAQHAVPLQKDSRLTGATKGPNIIAPIRRRSWHQIYRMLEFESGRKKTPTE